MDTVALARSMRGSIGMLAMEWLMAPSALDAAVARGMPAGLDSYAIGRLRFGRHTVAVQAAGMTPLEAILSGPAGEWNAEFFGWAKPYPDVSTFTEAREEIEAHTDRLHAPDSEVLSPDESSELRALAKAAKAHASGKDAA